MPTHETEHPAARPLLRFLIGHQPPGDTRHYIADFKAQAAWKSFEEADDAWGVDGVRTESVITPQLDDKASELLRLLRAKLHELGDHDDLAFASLLSQIARSCYEAGLRKHETLDERVRHFIDSATPRP